MSRHLPTREGYDLWSEIYDAEDNPLIALESRHWDEWLGDVGGLTVADIGCGTGRQAVKAAAAGADVTALDFSAGMLAKGRDKAGADRVRFIETDITRPLPLPADAFDRVICSLVLDHIPNLAELFAEMNRICKPPHVPDAPAIGGCRASGAIVISVMHPAMMLKGLTARFTDPQTGCETRPASCRHQIADYVTAVLAAGLRIDRIAEFAVDEALAAQSPRAAKYLDWPMLLMMRLSRQ